MGDLVRDGDAAGRVGCVEFGGGVGVGGAEQSAVQRGVDVARHTRSRTERPSITRRFGVRADGVEVRREGGVAGDAAPDAARLPWSSPS